MMAGLAQTRADLVAALAAGGLRATDDPRNAHPPCALVTVDRLDPRTPASYQAHLNITVAAPGPASGDALALLDDMLAAAEDALPYHCPAQLVAWAVPATGETVLAYTLAFTCPVVIVQSVPAGGVAHG